MEDVYTIKDMQKFLGSSYQKASKKMRDIKTISNRLNIKGLIHKNDLYDYLTYQNTKEKK